MSTGTQNVISGPAESVLCHGGRHFQYCCTLGTAVTQEPEVPLRDAFYEYNGTFQWDAPQQK